jgi:hypothetical protein
MAIFPTASAPDWSENHHRGPAKCRNSRPTRGDDVFFDDEQLALAVCNGDFDGYICPRRTECLYVAMMNCEPFGVWGGMTPKERLQLRSRHPGMPEKWTWNHAHEDEPTTSTSSESSTNSSNEKPEPPASTNPEDRLCPAA